MKAILVYRKAALALAAIASLAAIPHAHARVVVDGTRVVYPAARREVTINVRNPDNKPSLVQAWLDAGDASAKPGESKVPFVLTPPLFRLDPAKTQSLRMVYTRDPIPQDRESLFWLNVLDIPPRAAANPDAPNQLELAFKHRMKVFLRPDGLSGSAADAPGKLTWKLLSKDGRFVSLEASNPTPYHVSLIGVSVVQNGHTVTARAEMVDPFGSRSFDLPESLPAATGAITVGYVFINDYGGDVKGSASATATP